MPALKSLLLKNNRQLTARKAPRLTARKVKQLTEREIGRPPEKTVATPVDADCKEGIDSQVLAGVSGSSTTVRECMLGYLIHLGACLQVPRTLAYGLSSLFIESLSLRWCLRKKSGIMSLKAAIDALRLQRYGRFAKAKNEACRAEGGTRRHLTQAERTER